MGPDGMGLVSPRYGGGGAADWSPSHSGKERRLSVGWKLSHTIESPKMGHTNRLPM